MPQVTVMKIWEKCQKQLRKSCNYALECKFFKQASCQILHKKVFIMPLENENIEFNIAKEEVDKLKD